MKVRALGAGGILDLAARRGYWDGEDTGPRRPAQAPRPPPRATAPAPSRGRRSRPGRSHGTTEGPGEGTRFGGRSRHLTGAAVGQDYAVGVLIEAPDPGRRLCPRHWHTAEEEHALVLEGEVTLLLGEERHVMRPGDYVVFPAGQRLGHSFLNSGDGAVQLPDDRQPRPERRLRLPRLRQGRRLGPHRGPDLFDMTAARRYWDGEALD